MESVVRPIYFTQVDRGTKRVQLMWPTRRRAPRQIIADSSKSYVVGSLDIVSGRTNWRPPKNGDVIWFSERDGWGHLYHVGADGAIKHQITSGDWVVTGLLSVNESLGRVYFTGRGRESNRHPEYEMLYSVGLDGTGLTLLTPEDAYHK